MYHNRAYEAELLELERSFEAAEREGMARAEAEQHKFEAELKALELELEAAERMAMAREERRQLYVRVVGCCIAVCRVVVPVSCRCWGPVACAWMDVVGCGDGGWMLVGWLVGWLQRDASGVATTGTAAANPRAVAHALGGAATAACAA